jgi:hypothetical protein
MVKEVERVNKEREETRRRYEVQIKSKEDIVE